MKDARMFVVFWAINALLFYFLPFVFVGMVVTGNARLTPFLASVISGFLLSVTDALVMPACAYLHLKFKAQWQWSMAFLVVNMLGVWLIARYADLTGVGVTNAWTAALVGVLSTVVQWVAWMMIGKPKK